MIDLATLRALCAAHAPLTRPELVPELVVPMAMDPLPLWTALEAHLGAPVDAPYFVAPWPGAQALARLVLDGAIPVRGRAVVDLGAGSGLAALAAARAGASAVVAVDVDPLAARVAALGALENLLTLTTLVGDAFALDLAPFDVVLVGDLASRAAHAAPLVELYRRAPDDGRALFVADSGRPFFTAPPLDVIARYTVAVPPLLEGVARRVVQVFGPRAAR